MNRLQNARTIRRRLAEMLKRAEQWNSTSPCEDAAVRVIVRWLADSRNRKALDAWQQKAGGAR